MQNKKYEEALEVLFNLPMFDGVDKELIKDATASEKFKLKEYSEGEIIYLPSDIEKKLIVFVSGEAEVYSADEGRSVILKRIKKGGIVGVANLFSQEGYVSRVISVKKSSVFEISDTDFGKILEKDRKAMYNYLHFLSNRICYLNKKIVCLTAGSSERRLAYFLDSALSEQIEMGGSSTVLNIKMNSLCEMLDIGRASLYRAADKLCNDGLIKRDGKNITVINRDALLEKYK